MSCRRCGGKLFHTRGPAALKLRSPKLLYVRGTKHVMTAAERRGRRSVCNWMQKLPASICGKQRGPLYGIKLGMIKKPFVEPSLFFFAYVH